MKVNIDLSRKCAKKGNTDTLQKRRESGVIKFGACYSNSFRILSELPGALYVEGVAGNHVPIEHAWVQHNGEIVDVTWVVDDDDEMLSVIYQPYITLTLSDVLRYIDVKNSLPIEESIRSIGGIFASEMAEAKKKAYDDFIGKK